VDPYPHHYRVEASASDEGGVAVASAGLPMLMTWPPAQFGGPGDHWSPETLLLAAVSDCFVLTFRAIARAQKLAWSSLDCAVDGVLDREEGVARFTELSLTARLLVPADVDRDTAVRALHQAEKRCLISNSLVARRSLAAFVETAAEAALGDPA